MQKPREVRFTREAQNDIQGDVVPYAVEHHQEDPDEVMAWFWWEAGEILEFPFASPLVLSDDAMPGLRKRKVRVWRDGAPSRSRTGWNLYYVVLEDVVWVIRVRHEKQTPLWESS